MNNKLKIALIAVEVFALLVLLLVGVGCQQRWIVVTGDGPRFDWYAIGEDLDVDIQDIPDLPDTPDNPQEPEPEQPTDTPAPPPTTQPAPVATTPQPPEPEETTDPEESAEPDSPEDTTGDDRWGMGRF